MQASPQCVVLAGGLGKRMRPLTDAMPKNMLPVAGRPFAEHQLEFLIANGIEDIVYLIGYHGDKIREYFGDGKRWNVRIRYADEAMHLRGTAGALRLAFENDLLDSAFFVVYGDSFTPVPMQYVWNAFQASSMPALMTVLCNEGRWDRSNILYENNRIVVYDKTGRDPQSARMRHIDYGLSVLDRAVVAERVPTTWPADLSAVFAELSREGKLAAFEANRKFYEIGSPSGLTDFQSYLRESGTRVLQDVLGDRP